jgi:hypothetical protein
MDPLIVRFQLNNIQCTDEGDGPGDAEPYLWTLFFKIDGDTVSVNNSFKLQGTATVVSTPGNHGNLGVAEVAAGETVPIPPAIGRFQTTLKPIPVTGLSGKTVGGVAGCIAILMEEDSTPDDAIAQGHEALNKGVREALNQLIPTLSITKPSPTDADLKKLENDVSSAVLSAVSSNVSFWNAVWGFMSFGNNQDDQIGTAKFFFSHSQLDKSVGKPTALQQQWKNEGDWALLGSVSATKRVYDAVWRPGNSAEVQFYGMKLADYQKHYDELWKQNFRIYLLNTYEENAQRLYDAVWRPGNSAEVQFYGMKFADYQKHYDELWKQNFRIYLLNTYVENKQVRYDAVWRPGNDSETQFYGLGLSDYQSHYDELWKQGGRIVLLNTYEIGFES